jgi:hypothetical protein
VLRRLEILAAWERSHRGRREGERAPLTSRSAAGPPGPRAC